MRFCLDVSGIGDVSRPETIDSVVAIFGVCFEIGRMGVALVVGGMCKGSGDIETQRQWRSRFEPQCTRIVCHNFKFIEIQNFIILLSVL